MTEPSQMGLDTAMQYFDLSVNRHQSSDTGQEEYIITGVPKEKNRVLSKMEFYVDASRWVPVKILMYGTNERLVSQSEIEYKKISDIWVPVKSVSDVTTPIGKMKMETEFENIQVNKGIKDSEFKI
jgi:outer membrane lipoprotein-sorting protein